MKQLNRFLSNNYWNCPIVNYISVKLNDYPSIKGQCGNPISFFFRKN